MKRVIQYLFKGLTILLPLIVTLALVYWLLVTIEAWLRPFWEAILGAEYYIPGLALASFMLIAILIGFSTRWRVINYLWALPGRIMERMPVLRSLYSTINDAFDLMSGKSFAEESVVMVTLPGAEVKLIGIVTKKPGLGDDRLSSLLAEDHLAVFLPMAYNVGGYMVIVPRSCVEPLAMSPAEAMQLTMSGGLSKSQQPTG